MDDSECGEYWKILLAKVTDLFYTKPVPVKLDEIDSIVLWKSERMLKRQIVRTL